MTPLTSKVEWSRHFSLLSKSFSGLYNTDLSCHQTDDMSVALNSQETSVVQVLTLYHF